MFTRLLQCWKDVRFLSGIYLTLLIQQVVTKGDAERLFITNRQSIYGGALSAFAFYIH